jgi:hypothetical protein
MQVLFARECCDWRGTYAVSAVCSAALAQYITNEEPQIMKVISITALAFVAAAMLSGCNKSEDTSSATAPSAASTAAAAPEAAPAAPADATPPAASTAGAPAASGTAAPAPASTAAGQ